MTLQHYIAELLKQHNCVVLPDFGGFVGNIAPARVDVVKNKIHPPFKEVMFNQHLSNNDGLLADYIGKNESLDYPSAVNFIANEVGKWMSALTEGSRVEIGELGFLFQNGKAIVFEQNREVNLCLAAYGLKPVSIQKRVTPAVEKQVVSHPETIVEIEKEAKVIVIPDIKPTEKRIPTIKQKPSLPIEEVQKETPEIVFESASQKVDLKEDDNVISIHQNKSRSWVKYAVAAAILPFAFYSYWIPMETDFLDTGKIQMADFNPFNNHAQKSYELRVNAFTLDPIQEMETWQDLTSGLSSTVEIYNYSLADDFYIPIKLLKEEVIVDNDVAPEINLSANFQIIVGCFGVKNNADNLVGELNGNGHSASIYDQNKGLHRVSAGGFSSKSDAENTLSNLRSEGYSGWILKN